MSDPDIIVPMLTRMRDDINARFDALDARFHSLEDRIEHLEHHAAVTNSKLDAIYTRQQSIEVVRDETWAQIAATASFTNRFERRQASELAELRARIEKLESERPK